MVKQTNLQKFLESQSYKKDFKDLMLGLEKKYGADLIEENGIGSQLDISKSSKKFFKAFTTADVSVDANANVTDKSVISHKIETAKPFHLINSYYRLWKEIKKIETKEKADWIVESQIKGRMYINDFVGFSSAMAYCFNYSTYDTATMGIPSVFDGRGGSEPPKNLMSFLGQIELFSLIAGNSTLGATGLADLLIVIAIYMDKMLQNKEDAHVPMVDDKACWQYMESMLTGFIYRLNQPYRGSQSLFSNVSVYDSNFIDGMLEGDAYSIIIDDVKYSAKKEIVQKVQEIYLDIMNREMARKPITFPVTTACFSIDENNEIQDDDFLKFISEKNLKFGFINIYAGKSSTLSSCCRLRSERDNGEYFNSFGSGSTKIGSLGVATGNLPQLATICKESENPSDEFLHRVKDLVLDCQLVNQAKRNIIKRTIKAGSQPLYSLGYMELKRQYSTFGVIGLYEALEILGYDIMTKEGQEYVLSILNVVNTTNKELQDKYKAPHNCEQIPGENVSVKLAKKDRALGYNDKYTLYSNQFIPLIKRVNMFDRIAIQALFDKHFSGGAICHLNVNQEITDVNTIQNLIHASVKEGVVYFAVNFVLQECENKHMFVGNVDTCPHCGGKIIGTFTRVVGFLTKVDNWIPERREVDFPNRQFYGKVEI
jgi:ribonucleoside-triphosphate reductase